MRNLQILTILVAFLGGSQPAQAGCESTFGQHQIPPAPVLSPIIEVPTHAKFKWGTDVSMNGYSQWWGVNLIMNDDNGPPLALNWNKGGIFLPIYNPLPKGGVFCNTSILGNQSTAVPVLDVNAPIVFTGGTQNAAVYVAQAQSGPQVLPTAQQTQPPEIAGSSIETTYVDVSSRQVRNVRVSVFSDSSPGKFSLSVEKNAGDLIIGISDLADTLNSQQLATLRLSVQQQGFTVEQSTLIKFVGDEALVKELFWSDDTAAPRGELLFLGRGTKGYIGYSAALTANAQKRTVIVIILDANRRPIAANRVTLVVPQL